MPVSGGASDKLGNRYETFWAIQVLLDITRGEANRMLLEPLCPEESRGIEFYVDKANGTREHWSIKSQKAGRSGWSLALLLERDPQTRRSILGDLIGHLLSDGSHKAVFASGSAAPELHELSGYAVDKDTFGARLAASKKLNQAFVSRVLPLFGGDAEKARTVIQRIGVRVQDPESLRTQLDSMIRMLWYRPDGLPVDAGAVRGILAELLLDRIHLSVEKADILEVLGQHGYRSRDWAVDKRVIDQVDQIIRGYVRRTQSNLINGKTIPLLGDARIVGENGKLGNKRVLVTGVAGGGKSCALAHSAERLRENGVPVLTIRFDEIPEGVLSTVELGRKLGLPDSPVAVLIALARGGPCALVIDQLDAVSITSGRRPELWGLVEELRHQADNFPNLHLIVGCRSFDLEHDQRFRSLRKTDTSFAEINVQPLSPDQLDVQLSLALVDPDAVTANLRQTLRVPLHLSIYLSLEREGRIRANSRNDLFREFWIRKERDADLRLGRKSAWPQVIDRLSTWLSDHQQISAPEQILDDFSADAMALVSEHVLELSERRYRFFHESFFDYAFARRFVANGRNLLDLLVSSEQHLFRRAQVRQILSLLREIDFPDYLAQLSSVLTDNRIRFHLKKHVFQFLRSLDDPKAAEWEVLDRLMGEDKSLRVHIERLVSGQPPWFDVSDDAGFYDSTLSTGDDHSRHRAIWLLGLVLASRSRRVVQLLRKHRKQTAEWGEHLRYVVGFREVHRSPEMFDFFLSLIDDGTLKLLPDDSWWHIVHSLVDAAPAQACVSIGHWLDRVVAAIPGQDGIRDTFGRGHFGSTVIVEAAQKAPKHFVRQVMPRVVGIILKTMKQSEDDLGSDPIWSYSVHDDNPLDVPGAILSGLGCALEKMARDWPDELDNEITGGGNWTSCGGSFPNVAG